MTCTFFGHRDCRDDIYAKLKATIIYLITQKSVNRFVVGNNGNFDRLVVRALKECKAEFTHIDYFVALAYLPKNRGFDYPTVYFQGLEAVPNKFAISHRNMFMINECEWVIGYISHRFGGAYNFFELAKSKGKKCINLYIT